MRRFVVVLGVVPMLSLCACGRSPLDPEEFDDGFAGPPLDGFEGVAVRRIVWANERTGLAPDDGVWLVFGEPAPNCTDPVVSGGGVGWHIATYIPPSELGVGAWDYADSGHLDPAAHHAWILSWRGNSQAAHQLYEGTLSLDAVGDEIVRGGVTGVRTSLAGLDVPDPEHVEGDFVLDWCP